MEYDDWMAAAEEEYHRLDDLLRSLDADEWRRPTDCSEWDVRAVVSHLVGAAEADASVREMVRQAVKGRRVRKHGDLIDKVNAVQVLERASVPPERLVEDLVDAGRRAVARRRRLPAALLALPLPFGPPLGVRPLGYLMGRIYTRDAWMHRVDISRATGRELRLTADHDGRLVDDVVAEWAASHGAPYALVLTGPAGGRWSQGTAARKGASIEMDAVEFCRTVSGRDAGAGLLATPVSF